MGICIFDAVLAHSPRAASFDGLRNEKALDSDSYNDIRPAMMPNR